MLKEITTEDDIAYLRQISKPVDFSDKNLKQEIADIKEYCQANKNCYAMASVQLGIPKRMCYIKSTTPHDTTSFDENGNFLLINPKIVSKQGKTEFWEACVSCGNNIALVERPYKMVVEYQDETGEHKTRTFEGFSATVVSHELDHLDGIFHMDRAKILKKMTREERLELRQNNPYKIISQTCPFEYEELAK